MGRWVWEGGCTEPPDPSAHESSPLIWSAFLGTQIFETSFFVFQTIDCLIYELALEFHCRKATDEKITANEIFVQGERDNEFILTYRSLIPTPLPLWASFCSEASDHLEIGFCHLKKPFSSYSQFHTFMSRAAFLTSVSHEYC